MKIDVTIYIAQFVQNEDGTPRLGKHYAPQVGNTFRLLLVIHEGKSLICLLIALPRRVLCESIELLFAIPQTLARFAEFSCKVLALGHNFPCAIIFRPLCCPI